MNSPALLVPLDARLRSRAAGAAGDCFHCGEPVAAGLRFEAIVDGQPRPMCCAGCAAVAQAIADGGLADYYRRRERLPPPREEPSAPAADLRIFDRAEFQQGFVTVLGEHEREATLILEGLSCPACVWLNESFLARQPGVTAVHINYSTRRARVRWDMRVTRLSSVLAAIESIGYGAFPYDPDAMERSRGRERRDALRRLAVAALGMMQVMMFAYPGYVAGAGELSADASQLLRWASFVLAVPVVAYASLPFFRGALADLRRRRAGMDVPVALGIGAAFAASAWATVAGSGEVYFDSVTMFVCLLLGGRYLELRARHRAAAYLEYLGRALPSTAHRLGATAGGQAEPVPAGALAVGDRVLVRAGEAFPADGVIEEGRTDVDEALVTGESRPVPRAPGERVLAGSINRGNPVVARVDRVGSDSMLAGIVRLMERATAERPRLQVLADRVAARFVLAVLVLAAVAALYWAWADPSRALPVAVAILVVSCPCALSLATPMALAVANAAMARRGVVVTRASAIEGLAKATHVVFDKTGTLTGGILRVTAIHLNTLWTRERVLDVAAALEGKSAHPVAKAIAAEAGGLPIAVGDVREYPGEGMEGRIEGRRFRVGQRRFVAALAPGARGPATPPTDATSVWLGGEGGLLAQIVLHDSVRKDAPQLVADLAASGRFVMLLSGDGGKAVEEAARQAGILHWRARMLPGEKRETVRALQEGGAIVAMVGDGVNDAPVLAQAQVSIAMGGGAALAQGAADMVLVSPRLSDLGSAFRLSRKALSIVRQNLYGSAAYNLVALPLAAAGLVTPWMAGIGMSASSLLVVLNALRARHAA